MEIGGGGDGGGGGSNRDEYHLYEEQQPLTSEGKENSELKRKRWNVQMLHASKNLMMIGFLVSLFAFFVGLVIMTVEAIEYTHRKNHADRLSIVLHLSPECAQLAMDLNKHITQQDPSNEVDLVTVYPPQITLYNAQFLKEYENDILKA